MVFEFTLSIYTQFHIVAPGMHKPSGRAALSLSAVSREGDQGMRMSQHGWVFCRWLVFSNLVDVMHSPMVFHCRRHNVIPSHCPVAKLIFVDKENGIIRTFDTLLRH